MAKRRKEKDAEEEIGFRIPKFDEEKFIRTEKQKIKTTILSFIFGTAISLISFGFWVLLHGSSLRWILVLLFGIFTAAWLKYLFIRLNIDFESLGRKGIFSSYSIYFFTWLLLLIVLVNPPFYDDEAPYVEVVTLPGMQEPGGTVKIVARITDNAGVDHITLTINHPNGTSYQVPPSEYSFEDSIFIYTYSGPHNITDDVTYTYILNVTDVNKHTTIRNGTFTYSYNTLAITSSQFSGLMSGDSITINANEKISPWNFRVYYRINNGSEINVNRKDVSDKEKYQTSPEYEGWAPNTNLTLTVYAETRYYFENMPKKFSNNVTDTTTYNFSTGNDPNIGQEPVLVEYNYTREAIGKKQLPNTLNYKLPYPTMINVPGFELVLFMLSILSAVLIFKYRKQNKREP